MKELNLLTISLKDYFTKSMLSIVLLPLIGTIVVLYVMFFSAASSGLNSLENTQIQIEQHQTRVENGELIQDDTTHTYTGNSIIDFLLQYTITSWIVSFLVYFIGFVAIGYVSIFVSLLIVGLLTPKILSMIHRRHYADINVNGYGTLTGGIFKLLKSTLVMVILFLVFIPFYFIPFINIIAISLPFYYFFHKMLNYDVSSTLVSKEAYDELYYKNKDSIRAKTLFLYLVSLIPFVAFFIAVFYIIYIGHTYFRILKDNTPKGVDEIDLEVTKNYLR